MAIGFKTKDGQEVVLKPIYRTLMYGYGKDKFLREVKGKQERGEEAFVLTKDGFKTIKWADINLQSFEEKNGLDKEYTNEVLRKFVRTDMRF